jgi:hypothetical protein
MNRSQIDNIAKKVISDWDFDPLQHDAFEQHDDYSIIVLLMHMDKPDLADKLIQKYNYFKS